MRYTTIIDISDLRDIYRNKNAVLVYLHMALKAGYHDSDRDTLEISIRTLSAQTGVTVSAVRHALMVLQAYGLLSREGIKWRVKKWLLEQPISPRQKATTAAAGTQDARLGERAQQEALEYQRKVQEALRACSLQELQTWLQELQNGQTRRHRGIYIKACEQNVQWLDNYIKNR